MTRSRVRAVAVSVAAALLGAAGWLTPYRPVLEAGRPPRPGPYVLPGPTSGLRLHVLNTGANRMSALLVGQRRPWRAAPAFVLEHPRAGLIVIDAGQSAAVARDGEAALHVPMRWLIESRGRPGRTLDAQMRDAGLDPERVRRVIVSHMHDDHTGAAAAFRHAAFVGGPGVRGQALGASTPRWREVTFAAGRPLAPFDAAVDLLGDRSVLLPPGGGHTREDVMVLLTLPGGPALLTGDAVVHREWLCGEDVQRVPVDAARAADVRNQVRALLTARPDVLLVPGHDLGGLPRDRADVVLHQEA